MSHVFRFLSLSVLTLCLFLAAGCGDPSKKGPTVKGSVVLPPNVKLAENDSAAINFSQGGGDAPQFTAVINPADLTFVTSGPTGTGIVPGTYKITIILQPYVPGDSPQKRTFASINKRYGEGSSRLTYTVTEELEQSITIDLSKATVTKK